MSDDHFPFGTAEYPTTKLEREFWDFHEQNPHVYRLFDRFTRHALERGRTNFSVSVIVERIRWETTIETDTGDKFKINNNHRAYYARLWMRDNPEHYGFFRTRCIRGDNANDNTSQEADRAA